MFAKIVALLKEPSVIRFFVVGVASFAVDYGMLLVLRDQLKLQLNVATTAGLLTGLVVNFLMNKFWTFRAPGGAKRSTKQAALYGALVGVNLVFTNIFISVLAAANVRVAVSKPIATAIIMAFNYFMYRAVVFRDDAPVTPPVD